MPMAITSGASPQGQSSSFPNAEHVWAEAEWNFWIQPNHPLATGGWGQHLHREHEGDPADQGSGSDREAGGHRHGPPGGSPAGAYAGTHGVQIALSGEDALLVTVDVAPNRTVSFEHPEWKFGFDFDGDQGVSTRRSLLERAAAEKLLISTYHLPFPGIGHVTKTGGVYRWMPIDHQWQLN